MPAASHICIHGHFYQPDRENPWLDDVEVDDRAAPYHDWNERVTAECYARNAASRILDDRQRIARIINNYAQISFNVGPSLLRWLTRHHRDVWEQIVEADAQSRKTFYGHGNAIAQVYNHIIMPLASLRDKRTQVIWGIRDFERRFRRRPEGMWLAELAVDTETLEILATQHIAFTILAPHQARRIRGLPDGVWTEVTADTLDVTLPYRCRLPSGRTIALFFYHGPISREIAFGDLLDDGAALARRLTAALPADTSTPRVLLVAADGETYGHHHRFGEMALSFALDRIASLDAAGITNLAAYLAAHPPAHEVEIRERTSWSCVHGIERWRADCGCNTGKGWHQRWRGPLREAMTWLKDELDAVFERQGAGPFTDPWAARDEAVDLADRDPGTVDAFLRRHLAAPRDQTRRTMALKLLEMQRQGMLMQSSDGWFFDDISGQETVQILAHAARALELAGGLGVMLEEPFVQRLRPAEGNLPQYPDGAAVFDHLVRPMAVSTRRIVAQHAVASLVQSAPKTRSVYATGITELDRHEGTSGAHTLVTGRVRARSFITDEEEDAAYALVHFGGHHMHCAVQVGWTPERYEAVRGELSQRFGREVLSEILRAIDEAFGPDYFTLQDLLLEDRRRVLAALTAQTLTDVEDAYRRLYHEHRELMQYLREARAQIPPPMVVAAVFVLTRDLEAELARDDRPLSPKAFTLVEELRSWGREVRADRFEPLLRRRLEHALSGELPLRERLQRAAQVLDLAEAAGLTLNLWEAQNRFSQLLRARQTAESMELVRATGNRLSMNVDKLLAEVRSW